MCYVLSLLCSTYLEKFDGFLTLTVNRKTHKYKNSDYPCILFYIFAALHAHRNYNDTVVHT